MVRESNSRLFPEFGMAPEQLRPTQYLKCSILEKPGHLEKNLGISARDSNCRSFPEFGIYGKFNNHLNSPGQTVK